MKHTLSILKFTLHFILFIFTVSEISEFDNDIQKPENSLLSVTTEMNVTETNIIKKSSATILIPKGNKELNEIMKNNSKYNIKRVSEFNDELSDSEGVIISLENFKDIHCCDGKTVYIGAGVNYIELISILKENKMALENVPNDPHSNVINSILNGQFSANYYGGILASDVTEIMIWAPDGRKRVYTPRDNEFDTILPGFGFSGIIIGMTIKVVPEFNTLKCIYKNLSHFDFTRKNHLMFYGRNYSWFFLNLNSMKWEVHQVFRDDKVQKREGIFYYLIFNFRM